MDDSGQREIGRHKTDLLLQFFSMMILQWMIPQHHLKDNHATQLAAIMSERDNAIQERNIALAEKKAAMAERDMAIIQRDAAIAERNTAIVERDNVLAALEYARGNATNANIVSTLHASKNIGHHHDIQPQLASDPCDHSREMHVTDAYHISTAPEDSRKTEKVKRSRKETTKSLPKKTKSRKSKKSRGGEDLNKQATHYVKLLNDWNGEALNKHVTKHHKEWKDQDLCLNQVTFDDSMMPLPVCSCTGKYRQCYKWGNGGWQSACCTTTLSMYPLPVMPNKRHTRVGGRKMSGSVFTKLLSRLVANGHDLSIPVDLKDHWAKHGTNRYITIK